MESQRIGFVSTRFAGTDGVSLESAKWAQILWDHRHVSYWYAGALDRDPAISMEVPEAHFYYEPNAAINQKAFGTRARAPELTQEINDQAAYLKTTLYEFVEKFDVTILIVQNALCIPMQIPLGVALAHFIAETGIPTIAHHHDFYWERPRFRVNAVGDFLEMAFPPALPTIQHVTINSFAQQDLAWRKGASSILVPNVLDFENPDETPLENASAFREAMGIEESDVLLLQPTRVVPRKGIEHAISLVAQLDDLPCKLVITHESGDEGMEYHQNLLDMANQAGVDLRFATTYMDEKREAASDGEPRFALADAYAAADFITYPSLYEGFGNALLEAFYFRKPVLVNRYSIFIADIEPKGFQVVTMDGYLTRNVVAHVRRVLTDPQYRDEMVDVNFELSKAFYSYSVLRRKLRAAITNFTGHYDL